MCDRISINLRYGAECSMRQKHIYKQEYIERMCWFENDNEISVIMCELNKVKEQNFSRFLLAFFLAFIWRRTVCLKRNGSKFVYLLWIVWDVTIGAHVVLLFVSICLSFCSFFIQHFLRFGLRAIFELFPAALPLSLRAAIHVTHFVFHSVTAVVNM